MSYADIIARLEKATEHDDALNFDIAVLQGWKPQQAIIDGEAFTAKWTTPSGETRILCPWYTSSIDAALTLVPEGWVFAPGLWRTLMPDGREWWTCDIHSAKLPLRSGHSVGKTPAIALCIAALKAREATGLGERVGRKG